MGNGRDLRSNVRSSDNKEQGRLNVHVVVVNSLLLFKGTILRSQLLVRVDFLDVVRLTGGRRHRRVELGAHG